jgi:hypothetical protein
MPKPTSQRKCRFLGFFIGVDGVSVLLVCDMASDSHKNGYLIGKHPEGVFDILLSLNSLIRGGTEK